MSRLTFDPSRRAFLRGLGACVALPSLESLAPAAGRGPPGRSATTAGGHAAAGRVHRLPERVQLRAVAPEGRGEGLHS